MVAPITRAGKGSELSWAELDANFTGLAAAINLLVPTATSYSATILFTGNKVMPLQTVAGAIAFTADNTGAVEGGQVSVDLIANGTNVPSFTGLTEWDGSSGYVNTSGVRNCITFFRRGGKSYYSINQALGAPVEPVAPSAVTGLTSGATTSSSIALTWTAPSAGTAPITYTVGYRLNSAGGAYTTASSVVSGTSYTVTGLASSTAYDFEVFASNSAGSGTAATLSNVSTAAALAAPGPVVSLAAGTATSSTQPLTWSAPSTGGGSITDYLVEYKASSSGTWLTFSDGVTTTTGCTVTGLAASTAYDYRVSAFNGSYGATSTLTGISTAVAGNVVRASALVGLVESGDASAGYTYTTSGATWWASKSICDKSLPPSTDGWIEFTVGHAPNADDQFGIGFDARSSGARNHTEVTHSFNGITAYSAETLNTDAGVDVTQSVAIGDKVRIERIGVNTYFKVSTDGGVSYVTVKTIVTGAGTSGYGVTGTWYFSVYGHGTGGIIQNLRHSGLS